MHNTRKAPNTSRKTRALALLLVFALLAITGCSAAPAGPVKEPGVVSPAATQAPTTAPAPKDDTFALGDTAVFKTIQVTANELTVSTGEDFFEPESGNVFVGVQFTIENISDEIQNISSILLFDAYADDIKCDYSLSANCAFSGGTLDGEIAPGKKMVGYYAVEIPEDWSVLELQVAASWLSSSRAAFVFEHQA